LAFPCNQFGKQEPGESEEIRAVADGYGVEFHMFEKVLVNGAGAHPVFAFLKARLSDVLGQSIKWNFTKFLIGKDGTPVARFSPPTAPLSFEKEIERLLAEPGIDAALRVS